MSGQQQNDSPCLGCSFNGRKRCDPCKEACLWYNPDAILPQPSAPGTAPPQCSVQSVAGDSLQQEPRSSSRTAQSTRSAPLVFVPERTKDDYRSQRKGRAQAARPLAAQDNRDSYETTVRTQAARASAAQSRVTRARNRENRERTFRDGPSASQPTAVALGFAAGTIAPSLVEGPPSTTKSAVHRKATAGSSGETAQGKAERQQQLFGSLTEPYGSAEPPSFSEDALAAGTSPGSGNDSRPGSRGTSTNANRVQSAEGGAVRNSAQERPTKEKA
ncbi:hypothetical protein LTR37_002759 [Vermiconidia calcicola]|uniref:Uncharacterized protein n=1 Tax=Vermiconidia calcicola TaxID=1690605 RepID=A0ACC3NT31_9PEZI|nr:hypothetical protein LTR37_002759 [Vermiconidia calcicola]